MTQAELNRAVAQATGESSRRIAQLGFSPLTVGPVEREPQVVDWDRLDAKRLGLFPDRQRANRRAAC